MATVRLQLRRGTDAQWGAANPTLAAGEIGIETDTNTFKFGDGSTPWNSLSYALSQTVDDYILLSTKGVANGVASLDSSGFIPSAQLPPLAKVTVSSAANQAARLALTAEPGDIAIQSDNGTTYVLASSPASTNANWREISATAAISSAIATHEADTTAVHGIANTSLLVTTSGTQTLTNKTISTPSGIVKSDVGLGNVDNTSDENKPVSLATLSALDLKAPLASPALTGDATAVNLTLSGNLTVNGTTSTINSTTLTIQDKDIVLGQTATPTDAAADTGGIILKGTTDKSIRYSLAKSAWDFSENINLPGDKTVKINNIDVLTISTVLGKALPGVVVGTTETQTLSGKTLTSPAMTDPTFTGTVSLPSTTSIGNISGVELDFLNGATSNIQVQIDLKAPIASPTFTGTVGLPATTSIGLASADEIATLNGATSNIQAQIDLKAPIASPTFTGTVNGITKAMVGLTNVEDTADLVKPISTATQSALDLKAPLASPTFTGTVSLPSTTSIGNISGLELDLLNGATSNIQAQIDLKAPIASPTFTGTVSLPSTTSIGNISALELDLLNGATSNIQGQIDLKAPLASPTFTGTVTLPVGTVTSGMIADGAVATADIADVAVSTAKIADAAVTTVKIADDSITSAKIVAGAIVDSDINAAAEIATSKISGLDTALGLKAPLASPTFTGTVSGITKTMVGLANVDNTTDVNKPVSTATQTALSLKLNLSDPAVDYYISNSGSGSYLVNGVSNGNIYFEKGKKYRIHVSAAGHPFWIQTVSGGYSFGNVYSTGITNNGTQSGHIIVELPANAPQLYYACEYHSSMVGSVITGTTFATYKALSDLSNVNNTADASKPVSTAQATAIATAKSEAIADATSQVNAILTGAPAALNTLDELAAALGDDANFASTVTTSLSAKAPLASPTFTGTVTVGEAGIVFSDGTQTRAGVPSLTTIGTSISAAYNLSSGGLTLRDQLIPIAGAQAITVPANATTGFPIGTSVDFYQASGTGANFVAADTVTILRTPGLTLRTTYSSATLTKVAVNTWLLAGDLTA